MRTKKTDKPQPPPLTTTLRAALAQGWHTLDALDAMAPARGASDKRRAVHAALGELRAAGCVLEDRVHGGRVEVRLGAPPVEGMVNADTTEPAPTLAAPVNAAEGPFPRATICTGNGSGEGCGEAYPCPVHGGTLTQDPAPPKGPGPGSRCARCGEQYRHHATNNTPNPHPFQPKPRGRPRVAPPSPPLDAPPTAADVLAEIGTPLSRERLDAVRAWAGEGVAEPETSRGGSEETPSGAAQGFADTLRQAYPDAFKPEIIDGSDVATVAREMVDLTIAFSPVVARRDGIDAVDVTALDNGRFRVDALWESNGLPMEVDASGLAIMRARYLLLRGVLTRSLSEMDHTERRAVIHRFFRGVEPWTPAPGSPLARMGAGPITMAIPAGVGIEAIDFGALMGALAGEDGEVPDVVPVRPLGPPPPPAPPPEPPAAHVLEGEHSRACGYWKIHDPAHCDPSKLAAEIKLCRACWGKVYALGGGRPRAGDGRKYVGDRYV